MVWEFSLSPRRWRDRCLWSRSSGRHPAVHPELHDHSTEKPPPNFFVPFFSPLHSLSLRNFMIAYFASRIPQHISKVPERTTTLPRTHVSRRHAYQTRWSCVSSIVHLATVTIYTPWCSRQVYMPWNTAVRARTRSRHHARDTVHSVPSDRITIVEIIGLISSLERCWSNLSLLLMKSVISVSNLIGLHDRYRVIDDERKIL